MPNGSIPAREKPAAERTGLLSSCARLQPSARGGCGLPTSATSNLLAGIFLQNWGGCGPPTSCEVDTYTKPPPQPSGQACFRAARDCSPQPEGGAAAGCRSLPRPILLASVSSTTRGCGPPTSCEVDTYTRPPPQPSGRACFRAARESNPPPGGGCGLPTSTTSNLLAGIFLQNWGGCGLPVAARPILPPNTSVTTGSCGPHGPDGPTYGIVSIAKPAIH